MRQPVSRISFDRRRGFLGVQLQEGALFVDAAWNEASEIAWSQLRDAIVAGGIAGSAGPELRIAAETDGGGRLTNLRICGTSADGHAAPRPFYCDGLPVLWPADLAIDAQQPLGDGFRAEATGATGVPAGGTWIDLLQNLRYEIYLRARIATLDRLDDPFLDDPGLDATRGSFRKRVVSEVRIRKADAPRPPVATNLQLTIDGSYLSDENVLYRIELVALTGQPGAPAAAISWDPDAAATVARVVDSAAADARLIMVDSTTGFADGFVRFEGPGIAPDLYRVAQAPGLAGAAIQVTRHRCDRAEISLAAWQPSGPVSKPGTDVFTATLEIPAPVQAGDVLRSLPEALHVGWSEASVVAVTAFDPRRNAVSLTLRPTTTGQLSPRALAIADWKPDGPAVQNTDGSFAAVLVAPPAIAIGDVVTALPPPLGSPETGPWVVRALPPPAPGQPAGAQTITFGPAGLTAPLSTLDAGRKATLRAAARAFDSTITVSADDSWQVGDRISILVAAQDGAPVSATTIANREQRTIVRIDRRAGGHATMLVRLDQPLAYDHAADVVEVVPERLIRVRRFAGHECRLGIDCVDPARHGAASFAFGQPLADGLTLHLSIEHAAGRPRLEPGHGWHVAARSDGWVETRVFASVDEPPASEVALAELTMTANGHALVDVRPLPAGLALDDELAQIAAAAASIVDLIAGLPGDDPARAVLADVAQLAGHARVQPALLAQLAQLATVPRSQLSSSAIARPWLRRLDHAVAAVADRSAPSRRQLATIGFALAGLAFVLSTPVAGLEAKP